MLIDMNKKRLSSLSQILGAVFFRRFSGAAFFLLLALGQGQISATVLIYDPLNYTVDSPITGGSGGIGFGNDWTGGNATMISAPLVGSDAKSVQIGGSDPAFRNFCTAYDTATLAPGSGYYIAFLCSMSPDMVDWAGVSLMQEGGEPLFLGVPSGGGHNVFGFSNSTPVYMTSKFAPSTTYLLVCSLTPGAAAGTVDINMWATTDLEVNPSTLVPSNADAQSLGATHFSFDHLRLGGSQLSMTVQGLNMSDTMADAVKRAVLPETATVNTR